MNTTIKTNVIRIFEYLAALKDLTSPPFRDLRRQGEPLLWQADLPESSGCYRNGSGANAEAWLEVQRQDIPAAPQLPEALRPWLIETGVAPEHPPTRRHSLSRHEPSEKTPTAEFFSWIAEVHKESAPPDLEAMEQTNAPAPLTFTLAEEGTIPEEAANTNGRAEIHFDDDPRRVVLWQEWREQAWQAWAEAVKQTRRVNQVYDECFALYQRLQRESDQVELLIGDGLLAWKADGRELVYPIFVTRAQAVFEAETKSFAIVPLESGAALELEVLRGIPSTPAEFLSAFEARMREHAIDWRNAKNFVQVLRELAPALSENCEVHFSECVSGQEIVPAERPVFYHAPVVFLRNKAGKHWQEDFKSIIAAIKNDHPLPSSLAALATSAPLLPTEAARQKWEPLGENILFPLPANEEQKEIARRLAQHFGVAVQGPPGTGKSHTIVNLVAHLLAHGKRVLITSQTERALRVLQEMINHGVPEIAALCLSVLPGESSTREQLETAITEIHGRLATLEVESAARKLQNTEQELQNKREAITQLQAKLQHDAEAEHEKVCLAGRELNAAEVAEWLTQHQAEFGWIPDELAPECEPPLSEEEMLRLYQLLGAFDSESLALLSQELPPLEILPTAAQLAQFAERIATFEAGAPQREEALRGWTLPHSAPADLNQKIGLVEKALRKLESFSLPWLQSILQDVAYGGRREEYWQEFARECRVQLRAIRAAEKALAHYSVALPLAFDLKQARADLSLLQEELHKNKTPSMRFRYGAGKRVLQVVASYRLNGNAPSTAEDVQVLLRYLDIEEDKRKLLAQWSNAMRGIGGPTLEADDEQVLKIIEDYLRMLEPVLGWNNVYLRTLAGSSGNPKPYGPPAWHEAEWLRKYAEGLRAYAEIVSASALNDFSEKWTQFLREGLARENPHALWARLLEALEARDAQAWENEFAEVQRLGALLPQLQELQRLREKLRGAAPRWLSEIEQRHAEDRSFMPPLQWQKAWEWRRIHAWFEQRRKVSNAEDLHEQLRIAQAEAARLLESFIAQSTWLELAKRTTPEQKNALYAWLKTIQRLGKSGKGKYEQRYREEAAQLAQTCRPVIPVWIMPLEQVLATFAPAAEKFDVVIVDESSQCRLFALSALFRAERAVIIGDHKQVSPEAIGIEPAEVRKLIARHLEGVPHVATATWDLQASLFDKAQEAFASAQHGLILREHFRCAPEIIRFSNEQFYDGKIEPLRVPMSHERFEPALVTVRVPSGRWKENSSLAVNAREAEALVDKIVELCGDERYASRTMGVISLQGMAQAELIAGLLRERLRPEEIMQRRLICGDAKHFQGDERDVIFLSLVASAEPRPEPLTNRFAEQRFNVAASRARDQLWLFHSIDLENLQPDCMRARLLQYCLAPQRTENAHSPALESFEHFGTGPFARELYRRLLAQGYQVTPEVKIGTHPFRINLVVEGRHARLGIICEGERWRGVEQWREDLKRQAVLERAGWRLQRVHAAAFYRDTERTLAPLWQKLADCGIKPTRLPEALEEIFSD